MHKKTKAFTLVELIVVIVILSILATIAFLSFGSQSSSARDSTRLSDITQISKWLSVNATTTSVYAIPDKKIGIYSWSTLLGYQWEAWDSVKNVLKATSETFKDPLDKVNYTYSTNAARNKHQVLAFLENSNSISISLTPDTTTNAISYTSRYPYSKWDAMWIILSWSTTSNSYTPIQDISTIQTSTWFDITNTTVNTWMTAFVSNTVTSTWVNVGWLAWFNSSTNKITSCKWLLDSWVNSSWTYLINPTWNSSFQVYCDMSTDWGWWTLISKFNSNNSDISWNMLTSSDISNTWWNSDVWNVNWNWKYLLRYSSQNFKEFITNVNWVNMSKTTYSTWWSIFDVSLVWTYFNPWTWKTTYLSISNHNNAYWTWWAFFYYLWTDLFASYVAPPFNKWITAWWSNWDYCTFSWWWMTWSTIWNWFWCRLWYTGWSQITSTENIKIFWR